MQPTWETDRSSASQGIVAFYENWSFVIASHLLLSWSQSIQSMPQIQFLEDAFQYCSSIYAYIFQVVSFPQASRPNPRMHLSSPPYLLMPVPCHYCLVRNTDHKSPHNVVFSTTLLLRPSYPQIFSSAPYSQTPSAYFPPSMWAIMFHTHTKNRQNYSSVYLNLHIFG